MTDCDRLLLESLRLGNAQALATLYDAHARLVFSVACRILTNASEAEDVVQEVFLQVWRRAVAFDPSRGSLQSWLVMIARTRALDRVRRRDVRSRYIETRDDIDDLPEPTLCGREDALMRAAALRELRGRVDALPPGHRLPLQLALYHGFTHTEIADMLGMRLGTVKSRLRAALRRVREEAAVDTR